MSDSDPLEPYYKRIGETVINWGLLEQLLDCCVSLARPLPAAQPLGSEVPRELKRKIAYLKKVLKTEPRLSDIRDFGLETLGKISDIKQRRHDLIHGAIVIARSNSETMRLSSLDVVTSPHKTRESSFRLDDFPRLVQMTRNQAKRLARLAIEIGQVTIELHKQPPDTESRSQPS